MIHLIPNWNALKSSANSNLAKYSIIVPLVGWLLLYNYNLELFLEQILEREINITIGWRLHVFYIGVSMIASSAAIFSTVCPSEVSFYSDIQDFVNKQIQVYTQQYGDEVAMRLSIGKITLVNPAETYMRADGDFPLSEILKKNEGPIKEQLVAAYNSANSSKTIFRLTAGVLFLAGAMLVLIPTISTVYWSIQQVINLLIHHGNSSIPACPALTAE